LIVLQSDFTNEKKWIISGLHKVYFWMIPYLREKNTTVQQA